MQSKVETINAAVAQRYLRLNSSNRPVRPRTVQRYARAMLAGDFKLTHQGIAFDKDGILLDGQHRLYAVIETNAVVQMNVTRGAERETFAYLDSGERRSVSDQLRIHQRVGEVVTLAATILQERPSTKLCARVNEAIGQQVAELFESCTTVKKVFSSAAVKLAAVISIEEGQRQEYVHTMYRDLVNSRIEALPPSGHAFVRQVLQGHATVHDRNDLLARSLVVFDESSAHVVRVQVKNSQGAIDRVRAVLNELVRVGS